MKNREYLTLEEVMAEEPPVCQDAEALLKEERNGFVCKLVVLDDDPTGIQTVNQVSVYTDWSEQSIREGFEEECNLFFILTNSRGMTEADSIRIHREIGTRVAKIAKEKNCPFLIISRGDSTLRGHYPAETETLRQVIEQDTSLRFDGEILCPFFPQGGRYTVDDIHYVYSEGRLIPAAQTEFATDRTFGYRHSHLGQWVEEKTAGDYPAEDQCYIGLDLLRGGKIEDIVKKLEQVEHFDKVIVNALAYEDLYVFMAALLRVLKSGKKFMFRTAASFPEVLGGVESRPLLMAEELIEPENENGGLIVVGSHVKKTTVQLEQLLTLNGIVPIPFRSGLVYRQAEFDEECRRVQSQVERELGDGRTAVIYTERTLLVPENGDPEEALKLSLRISDAVTDFVRKLQICPRFIIAKGGITSSEIGVKGLGVRRAVAAGQILPGIPVWMTGEESRFPGLPYVIFPGNVGEADSLKKIVERLLSSKNV